MKKYLKHVLQQTGREPCFLNSYEITCQTVECPAVSHRSFHNPSSHPPPTKKAIRYNKNIMPHRCVHTQAYKYIPVVKLFPLVKKLVPNKFLLKLKNHNKHKQSLTESSLFHCRHLFKDAPAVHSWLALHRTSAYNPCGQGMNLLASTSQWAGSTQSHPISFLNADLITDMAFCPCR